MSQFQTETAQDANARADTYSGSYAQALQDAGRAGGVADLRATAALILNVSATAASMAVLIKRRGLLLLFAPIFVLGIGYLAASLI
jgi:hypothetical protein